MQAIAVPILSSFLPNFHPCSVCRKTISDETFLKTSHRLGFLWTFAALNKLISFRSAVKTSCTFAKVLDKMLLDPDSAEESIAKARVTIANDGNELHAMQKGMGGSFSPAEINELISATFESSKELRGIIKKSIGD